MLRKIVEVKNKYCYLVRCSIYIIYNERRIIGTILNDIIFIKVIDFTKNSNTNIVTDTGRLNQFITKTLHLKMSLCK